MDAETAPQAPLRPSEDAMARDPAAIAGRTQVEARLASLTPDQRAAFWDAVRHCYVLGTDSRRTRR